MLPNRSVCTNLGLFDIFQPVLFGQCYGVITYIGAILFSFTNLLQVQVCGIARLCYNKLLVVISAASRWLGWVARAVCVVMMP